MDIAQGNVGSVGAYDIDFEGGKMVIKFNAGVTSFGAFESKLSLDAAALKDSIKKKIPGQIDDLILDNLFLLLGK